MIAWIGTPASMAVSELLSAPVQGGVNHSRLHSLFLLASPERLRECLKGLV